MADFSFSGNDVSNQVGNNIVTGANSVSTSYQVGSGPAISAQYNSAAVGQPTMEAPRYNGPQVKSLDSYNASISSSTELKTGGVVRKAPGLGR